VTPPGELALVGSPPKIPSSQGSTVASTPVDRIREPTSCTLVFLSGRHNTVMEVATGVAHPLGGLHHNNKILPDYTRVEVHTLLEIPPVVTFYLYDRHVLFRLYKIVGMFL